MLRSQPSAHLDRVGALSAAVRASHLEATKLLLKVKADPNERDDKGVSPLHLAAFDGNLELCKQLILARAEIDACHSKGKRR